MLKSEYIVLRNIHLTQFMSAAPYLPAKVSTNCGDPAIRGSLRERHKAINTGAFMFLFRNWLV
eukprot:9825933-Karenia_brevis.AAC.1